MDTVHRVKVWLKKHSFLKKGLKLTCLHQNTISLKRVEKENSTAKKKLSSKSNFNQKNKGEKKKVKKFKREGKRIKAPPKKSKAIRWTKKEFVSWKISQEKKMSLNFKKKLRTKGNLSPPFLFFIQFKCEHPQFHMSTCIKGCLFFPLLRNEKIKRVDFVYFALYHTPTSLECFHIQWMSKNFCF